MTAPAVKRSCLFLDRDGVINVPPAPGGYLRTAREFRLMPAIADWIRLFRACGFLVIVVTNQRGVARGLTLPEDLAAIHARMSEELQSLGAPLDDILCCPHDEGQCDCRKPRPGLVREAGKRWNIDLPSSLMIGDSECDRQLAENCGMSFARARDGHIIEIVCRARAS